MLEIIVILASLIIRSAAFAQSTGVNVLVDGQGNVVRQSGAAMVAGAGETYVANVSAPPEAYQPGALQDDYGRYRWRLVAGVVTAQLPRWPQGAAAKRAAAEKLRLAIRETLIDIDTLERWQADPANVAVADRANELTAAQTRLGQLRDILAGN